jgi:hypothetical protein
METREIEALTDELRLREQLAVIARAPFGAGRLLLETAQRHKVAMAVRPGVGGGFWHSEDGSAQAVAVGPDMGPGDLAHELRHAWQYNAVPRELYAPDAPGEALAALRAQEADARAVGCFISLFAWHDAGLDAEAAKARCYDSLEIAVLDGFYAQAPRLMSNPVAACGMLRMIFERVMTVVPEEEFYERHFARVLTRRFNGEAGPALRRADDDMTAISRTARALGRVGTAPFTENYVAMPHHAGIGATPAGYARPGTWTGPVLEHIRGGLRAG